MNLDFPGSLFLFIFTYNKKTYIMKDILEGTLALFLFKPYTNMPRVLEIGYGIMAWFCLLLIAYICI